MKDERNLFKARRKDNGEWVYGYFIKSPYNSCSYIVSLNCDIYIESWDSDYMHINNYIEVDKRTVCRNTFIRDRNGNYIYEHDIDAHNKQVRYDIYQLHPLGYGVLGWMIGHIAIVVEIGFTSEIEIVGNVYDSLDVIEKEEI